ncbi:MAG: hypothetical protein OXD31_04740 [Chloroflexi bacterium]|nr:hypothetical protein [Chloroflexota bacterium]
MTDAKWKLMVDWSGDGRFAGADDDITHATQGLSLRHMRDLETEYMEPARLDIRLANSDHKYSPPNSASPLSGNVRPGRKVWLRAAFPYDDFGDVPGTSLADHSPEYGKAYRWTTANQDFRIATSGGAQTDGARSGRRIATIDFGLADASFGCEFVRGSDASQHGGLALRYTDADNFLYLRVTGTALELRKVERQSDTLLAETELQWNPDDRRFIQIELHGDSIRVFVDRQQMITARSTFNTAATQHGLYCDGAADHLWQQFGGWVSLFYGDLHSIDPQPGAGECHLRVYDEMRRLESVTLYMYATSPFPQTSDEILGDILDYSGVDATSRLLDSGMELVPQLWSPPLWGVQAADEILHLQDEEDGFIYVDGNGLWRIENRSHRELAPHTTARAVLRSQGGGADGYFSDLEYSDGVGNIENKLFMRIRDATNHGHRTVWTLGETPYFDAGAAREFLAESKDFDVVGGHLSPLPNTDFAANTEPDGTGTDITEQLTVTYPASRLFNGKGTLVRVQFGSTAGYLTRLGMRSVNALTFNAPLLLTAENPASGITYGQRIRSIEARWTRETQQAQATLERRLARRSTPRTALKAALPGGSDANTLLTLQLRLSDRIALSYPDMGINGDFFVEGHTLEVGQGGKRMERVLLLQQA